MTTEQQNGQPASRQPASRPPESRQPIPGQSVGLGSAALFGEIALSFVIAVFVKWLHADLPVFAILFCRYLFCLPLLLAYGWHQRGPQLFRINNIGGMTKRCIAGLLGLTTWFIALGLIDLSLATALGQMMPIFITILAAPMLGEVVGIRRIAAVVAGFAGVMILLGPVEFSSYALGIAFGLAFPFLSALMFIYLRQIGRSDSPVSTSIWHNIAGVFYALVLGLFDGSMPALVSGDIEMNAWFMLIAIGVTASFQQFLMALSHTLAPASVLAPLHYTAIPMGVVIGMVFFGETITASFIIGVMIVVMANYYILMRERAQRNPKKS